MRVKEGLAEIEVPSGPVSRRAPVFYNPRAKLSRDLSVLILKVLRPPQVIDSMCGTGIRGIRYALEAGVEQVIFNDINPRAVELARRNARANGVEGEFLREDVNLLFHRRRFYAVDLDPFGPPSPFLQAAARSATNLLLVSATDTSPLTGNARRAAVRKYHAVLAKTEWYRELAVRVLLGYVQHHLMIWEKALIPVFSFFAEHHVRVIGRITRKISEVNRMAGLVGLSNGLGPLWKGPIYDREVVLRALEEWNEMYEKEARRLLELAAQEIDTVGYVHLHMLAHRLRISPPPVEAVVEELRGAGFRASRSALEPRAIKTDAPSHLVEEIVKGLAARP